LVNRLYISILLHQKPDAEEERQIWYALGDHNITPEIKMIIGKYRDRLPQRHQYITNVLLGGAYVVEPLVRANCANSMFSTITGLRRFHAY